MDIPCFHHAAVSAHPVLKETDLVGVLDIRRQIRSGILVGQNGQQRHIPLLAVIAESDHDGPVAHRPGRSELLRHILKILSQNTRVLEFQDGCIFCQLHLLQPPFSQNAGAGSLSAAPARNGRTRYLQYVSIASSIIRAHWSTFGESPAARPGSGGRTPPSSRPSRRRMISFITAYRFP